MSDSAARETALARPSGTGERKALESGDSSAAFAKPEIEHNELRSAAIMPHGFFQNVTQITGLARNPKGSRGEGGVVTLGYNPALFCAP